MKVLKYASLITLTLGLLGGLTAERASAQARSAGRTASTAQAVTPVQYVQQLQGVQINQASQGQATPQVAAPAGAIPGESDYDRYMRLGYAESRLGNYQGALQYFESALAVNPGDRMATIAYWNMVNALETLAQRQQSQQTQSTRTIARISNGGTATPANDFDSYMNAGYDAVEARDYPTALQYFNSALQLRPNNPYAQQAILNVNTYLQAGSAQGAAQ